MIRRLIVAITGASGAIYGVRLLQMLREMPEIESHLVISQSGALTATQEVEMTRATIESLADVVHSPRDIGSTVSSGSFRTMGMVVAPCSMKTLASIAMGFGDNLISRAADVTLKERRPLVLMARESPLNLAHLRHMCTVTEMGGIICPPVPAFHARPRSLADMVDYTLARVLDLFELQAPVTISRWAGLGCQSTPFVSPEK